MPLICVAGKNQIACDVLAAVLRRGDADVVAAINRRDTGQDGWQPSYAAFARAKKVRVVERDELRDRRDLVFLSMEYDRLLIPSRFASSRLFNIHFSLLPAYRGMYTSAWPILRGETRSGVTLHYIDAGIDTGDIIAQDAIAIEPSDTARDLYLKYLSHGSALVVRHLEVLIQGTPPGRPQPKEGASYFSKESICYGPGLAIDFRKTAWEVQNQVRAFTFREYQLVKVGGVAIVGATPSNQRSTARPGTIVRESRSDLTVATIDYDVVLRMDVPPRESAAQ